MLPSDVDEWIRSQLQLLRYTHFYQAYYDIVQVLNEVSWLKPKTDLAPTPPHAVTFVIHGIINSHAVEVWLPHDYPSHPPIVVVDSQVLQIAGGTTAAHAVRYAQAQAAPPRPEKSFGPALPPKQAFPPAPAKAPLVPPKPPSKAAFPPATSEPRSFPFMPQSDLHHPSIYSGTKGDRFPGPGGPAESTSQSSAQESIAYSAPPQSMHGQLPSDARASNVASPHAQIPVQPDPSNAVRTPTPSYSKPASLPALPRHTAGALSVETLQSPSAKRTGAKEPLRKKAVTPPTPTPSIDLLSMDPTSVEISAERHAALRGLMPKYLEIVRQVEAERSELDHTLEADSASLDKMDNELSVQLRDLAQQEQQLSQNVEILRDRTKRARQLISKAESAKLPDSAEELLDIDAKDRQAAESWAGSLAIDSGLQVLTRALDTGNLELHVYLRLVRQYARDQFWYRHWLSQNNYAPRRRAAPIRPKKVI